MLILYTLAALILTPAVIAVSLTGWRWLTGAGWR